MADNNSSGQDTRHSGASGIPSAPSDCSSTRLSGPTSAKKVKRTRSTAEERSPDSAFGSKTASSPVIQGPLSPTRSSKRTHFTPQQIYKLEQFFLTSQFPTAKERENLAKDLQLSTKHIQVWFQNHRAKYKRKEKKKAKSQKSTMKLQPPRSWPAQLPFDSSIASVNLGGNNDKDKQGSSSSSAVTRKETKNSHSDKKGSSISPSYSISTAGSSEVSGSTLRSSGYSPEKLTAYPLSPSSPLNTPRAPLRRQSSSIAPSSPLSSSISPSISPRDSLQSKLSTVNPSPVSGSTIGGGGSSTGATNPADFPHVYSTDVSGLNCLDTEFQNTDFSPPIFAESPVHLHNLLDDPDIGSILREHLPAPPKKISVTDSVFQSSYPNAPQSSSPYFHPTHMSHIGGTYGGSSSTHQHFPINYHPLAPVSQPSPLDTAGLLHPISSHQSSFTSNRLRATRQPYTQTNPYRQPTAAVPAILHAATDSYDTASPAQYPSGVTGSHIHPFAHAYAHQYSNIQSNSYHSRPSISAVDSAQFVINRPPLPPQGPAHHVLPGGSHHGGGASSSQVHPPSYRAQTPPSVPPITSVSSSNSSILFDQSSLPDPPSSK